MRPLRPGERLIDTNPLLRVLLPFMFGIAAAEWGYSGLESYTAQLATAAVVSVFVCLAAIWGRRNGRFFSLLFLLFFNVGLFLLGAFLLLESRSGVQTEWPSRAQAYRAMVTEKSRETEKTFQVMARLSGGRYDGKKVRLVLMKPKAGKRSESLVGTAHRPDSADDNRSGRNEKAEATAGNGMPAPGDVLLLHAKMEIPRNAGNPGEFDYAGWLRRQGVAGTAFCFSSQWCLLDTPLPRLPFSVRALRFRERLLAQYENHFGGRNLGILSAMTLGDKTRLDSDTREVFSQTGVSHVLALSGLHLGVLFAVYNFFVLSFFRRRRLRVAMSLVGVCGLWLFAFLSGFPVSLLRAVLMFTIMQLSMCLHRDNFSVNNLTLAALLILLFSPQSLFDIGFQFSCLSVFSILLFPVPPASHAVARLRRLFFVSLAAQVGTLPLVAYYFHTLPVLGLLSQFVAVPLTFLILSLSGLFLLLPFCQSLLAAPINFLLTSLQDVLSFFTHIPGSVWTVRPTLFTVFALYVGLAVAVAFWRRRRPFMVYALSVVAALIVGVELYESRPGRVGPALVFYNIRSASAVHAILSPGQSYLWSGQPLSADAALTSVRRTYWADCALSDPVWLNAPVRVPGLHYADGFLRFGRLRVLMLAAPVDYRQPESPVAIDYLYLTKGVRTDFGRLYRCFRPSVTVLDATLPDWQRSECKRAARACGLTVYDMRERGALVVRP